MIDESDIVEQEGIIVKQEHAYASKEESNTLQCYDSSEEDPLRILPFDVSQIKTENESDNFENVEIKVEPNFGHDEEDMEFSEFSENANGLVTDTFETVSTENINCNEDFVPKSLYVELQNKYNNMCNKYAVVMSPKNKAITGNNIGPADSDKMDKNRIIASIKELNKDLKGAMLVGNKLKFEINYLTKQNVFLRKKLKECNRNGGYEQTVEKSLKELKEKVQHFIKKEKQNYVVFKNFKSQLEYKECEEKILEKRLQQAIFQLENVKQKLLETSTLRTLLNETQIEKEKLQKELTDCMKVRYLYEDHAELIKRELNTKLIEKEGEIEKHVNEIKTLSNRCNEYEHNEKLFREKFKTKNQHLERKLKEIGKMFVSEKQKSTSLREKVLGEHNQNTTLMKKIDELKKELESNEKQKKSLEGKLADKHQENVILREEIAMLKVELEKYLPKLAQC